MNAQTKKILVVDDNIDLSEVLALLLSSEGYEVSTAGDGSAALLHVTNSRPDAIVSDVRMPVMDGIAMLQQLRSRTDTRDIPVVFIFGMASPVEHIELHPLQKPVKIDELLARLTAVLCTDQ